MSLHDGLTWWWRGGWINVGDAESPEHGCGVGPMHCGSWVPTQADITRLRTGVLEAD